MSKYLQQPLHRSATQKMIAGVCGGLAESFGVDVNLVRLLFILSLFLPGTQVIIYLVLWVLFPVQ
ncbi:PspC domain-containing protein [Corynebacterium choanae]|nr:PspC domain-containing protein [Corynebacterium choanae]